MSTPFKMTGFSGFGNSPMKKDKGEVVSKTSPGEGWTKTKGTNIWAPPKGQAKLARMQKTVERKKGKMTKTVEPIKRFTKKVEPIKRFTKTVGPNIKKKKILDLTPTSKRN